MKRACVIGWPIEHSRSPLLHRFWLKQYGIEGDYDRLPVRPAELATALRGLAAQGYVGCNLTKPHKDAALALLDRADPVARRVGAVNTVVIGEGGVLEGRNTDVYGFLENLRATLPDWRADTAPAVVLGAGGAARAVVAALLDAGVPEIRLVNRSPERAAGVAAALGGPVTLAAWDGRASVLAGAGLLVNATNLGQERQPPLDLPLDALPQAAVVYDIVYVPLETPLLAAARARGHRVVDGLGMLLHQARPAFAAWFGLMPEVTPALREAMMASLKRS